MQCREAGIHAEHSRNLTFRADVAMLQGSIEIHAVPSLQTRGRIPFATKLDGAFNHEGKFFAAVGFRILRIASGRPHFHQNRKVVLLRDVGREKVMQIAAEVDHRRCALAIDHTATTGRRARSLCGKQLTDRHFQCGGELHELLISQ